MKRILMALLVSVLAGRLSAQGKPNLLKNGDFEEVKPDGKPVAWNGWKKTPVIEHKLGTEAHSGKRCAYFATKNKGYHGGYAQSIKLKAGCRYRYSAWVKFKNHGDGGKARCCYQETRRDTPGTDDYKYINSFARDLTEDCDWTYLENTFDTLPDKDSNYSLHVVLGYGAVEVWVDDVRLIDCGSVLAVDNGKMKLHFGNGLSLVGIDVGKDHVGALSCDMAQFEKEGIGYKKTGVGWPRPVMVKSFQVKERDAAKCVVDVTCEWTDSAETQRTFEAVYRITVLAGQPWLESRLVSIKNTDRLDYEVRGYYHSLRPADPEKVRPRCFPACAVWLGGKHALGAAIRNSGDFVLGLRKSGDQAFGDITRELRAKLKPGETWQGDEPGVFVFVTDEATDRGIVEMRRRILDAPAPTGTLTYEEAKAEGASQ